MTSSNLNKVSKTLLCYSPGASMLMNLIGLAKISSQEQIATVLMGTIIPKEFGCFYLETI